MEAFPNSLRVVEITSSMQTRSRSLNLLFEVKGKVEGKVDGKVPTYQIFFDPHWQSQRRSRGSQFLLHTSSLEKKFLPSRPHVWGGILKYRVDSNLNHIRC
jgi:hypothetical protein